MYRYSIVLIAGLFSTFSLANTGATTAAPSAHLESGFFMWVLDETGAMYDDVKLRDNTAPPFRMDAHIRAKKRYKNFSVGGLVWNGLLKVTEPGTYHVRITTNVNISGPSNWRVYCESTGMIANVPVGSQSESKFYDMTGVKTRDVFENRIKISDAGAHPFTFRLRCRNGVGKSNRWIFDQSYYSNISSTVEMLSPSDDDYRLITPNDIIRRVKN